MERNVSFTVNGVCLDDGSKAFYTFPKEAVYEINDVSIPLEEITAECFGGRFDTDSMEHFTDITSRLNPHRGDIYNTPILIIDSYISGDGYPSRDDFLHYGIDYLSPSDFNAYRNRSAPLIT